MCPSCQATRDEKDSTRGRAPHLQEMINGTLITNGWRTPEVHDALDLCLSCKGCARDCPTGTDMAAYKARVQYETFKGRLRPRNHYSLGWLPRWGRLITTIPRPAAARNAVGRRRRCCRALAGAAASTPTATCPLRLGSDRALRMRVRRAGQRRASRAVGRLLLRRFESTTSPPRHSCCPTARAAGSGTRACCGLTWISTGQLDGAIRELRNATEVLHPYVARGEDRRHRAQLLLYGARTPWS